MLTLEAQTIARACGKSHVHNLEPEDLVALTIEAAAMARVPLAGTNWIPGRDAAGSSELGPAHPQPALRHARGGLGEQLVQVVLHVQEPAA